MPLKNQSSEDSKGKTFTIKQPTKNTASKDKKAVNARN